jgi:uroporphyrinogen-III synthase
MRVLITQAVQDAAAVAAELQNRGHHALTVPVVNVERTAAPSVKLEGAQGFIVTSPDGARALAETISVRTFPVFADSGTTASELERLGFKSVKAAKDDSAGLAKLIEKTANPNYGALIYACSTTAPVQLSALLSNMGFAVRTLPLYSIKRVDQIPPELLRVLEKGIDAALFLSADEARAFVALIQREQLDTAVRDLKAVAANPVVAAPLRALKLGAVVVPPSGDLETVFGALDQKLVDKVEEERLERERAAREVAERKRAEDERRAKERAEKERLEREQSEKQRIEEERVAAEQAEREREAREKADQERLTKEKAAAVQAEQKRAAIEKAEQEKRERKKNKEEQAALAKAEKARLTQEKAERVRAEKEKATQDKAEQKRAEEERRAIEKAQAEQERRARAQTDQERLAVESAERSQREESDRERRAAQRAERERQAGEDEVARKRAEAEEAEQKRLAREQADRESREAEIAEQERVAAEKAERERLEVERNRIAAEAAKQERTAQEEKAQSERERAERRHAEKEEAKNEAAAKKKPAADDARREKQKKDSETPGDNGKGDTEDLAPRSFGGRFRSWFAPTSRPEPTGPMFARFQHAQEPESAPTASVESNRPSDTLTPPVIAATPVPKTAQDPPPKTVERAERPPPEEKQNVSQERSTDPADDTAPPKVSSSKPATASKRGGGRAERLRAEDAADQQARQQRYKNFDIPDTPTERSAGGIDHDVKEQVGESSSRGGIGRIAALFVVLVVVATGIFGTASWWVPQVTQLVQGTDVSNPSASAPVPETAGASSPASAEIAAAPQTRSEAPEQVLPNSTSSDALTALETELTNRIRALEQGGGAGDASVISLSDSLSSQARQLAAVSARLATLEAAIGNSARLEDLSNRIVILEGKSADAASVLALSDRVASLEETSRRAVAEQTAEVALLMATAQLREAIVAGRPFATELETAKALSTRVLNVNIEDQGFAAYAARGIPSLTALQRRFDETAAQTVRAAAIPDGASGWIRQSLDRLMSIITVRRVSGDVAGSGVSSILARAENRLSTGDIAGAVVEIATLSGAAAESAALWLTDARARIAADQAITATLSKAMALMAVDERARTPVAASAGDGE